MWPSYKPVSWDKYYAHNLNDKHTSITSGLAAGITIGVFFTVFLLTFGCRLYSRRVEAARQSSIARSRRQRRPSVSDLYIYTATRSNNGCLPPPPYELAIQMPKPPPNASINFEPPPSFNEAVEAGNNVFTMNTCETNSSNCNSMNTSNNNSNNNACIVLNTENQQSHEIILQTNPSKSSTSTSSLTLLMSSSTEVDIERNLEIIKENKPQPQLQQQQQKKSLSTSLALDHTTSSTSLVSSSSLPTSSHSIHTSQSQPSLL